MNLLQALVLCVLVFVIFLIISYLYLYSVEYFGIVLILAAFLLFLVVSNKILNRIEAFGMSPGTLVQLQSTHVPTQDDYEEMVALQREQNADSIELTGSL
jgi:hypothetical protein